MSDDAPPRPQPWFTRSFRFETPASLTPEAIERLRGTPAALEEGLRDLDPALATRAPADGSWSIQTNVGHLGDLEPLWEGRVEDFLERRETLRPADVENTATEEAGHDLAELAALCARFRERRAALVARLDALPPEAWEWTALHPRLGTPMRVIDLCTFVGAHDDCHLARITLLQKR